MIGIDIGSRNIKLCKIHLVEARPVLTCALMGEYDSVGKTPAESETLAAQKVREIIKDVAHVPCEAIASVGTPGMVTHNLLFPSLSDEELRGAVDLEIRQAVSIDLENMSTDFQVLADVENGQKEVMFVAVPNDAANRILRVGARGGLDVKVVDIDNMAVANCFTALEPDVEKQSAVILNIGFQYTNIIVIDGGKVRFVRNVAFGGQTLTEAIARQYAVAPNIAEEIKKQSFLWNAMGLNMKNILRQCMPDLLEAVYRSIEYCMNRKRLLNVDRILLTGGGANLTGLDKFISEVFGIDSERWNPLDYFDLGESDRKEFGHYLSLALGLALRANNHA